MTRRATAKGLNVALLGGPGAGKRTQAVRLADRFGLVRISASSSLRTEMQKPTALAELTRNYVEGGHLIPDELISAIVGHAINGLSPDQGIVLDDYPRTEAQALALERAFSLGGRTLNHAIELELRSVKALERIARRLHCSTCGYPVRQAHSKAAPVCCDRCGGTDFIRSLEDTRAKGRLRLVEHRARTAAISGFYAGLGLLRRIDGHGDIEAVHSSISKLLQH